MYCCYKEVFPIGENIYTDPYFTTFWFKWRFLNWLLVRRLIDYRCFALCSYEDLEYR